jgi:hypothetical protein
MPPSDTGLAAGVRREFERACREAEARVEQMQRARQEQRQQHARQDYRLGQECFRQRGMSPEEADRRVRQAYTEARQDYIHDQLAAFQRRLFPQRPWWALLGKMNDEANAHILWEQEQEQEQERELQESREAVEEAQARLGEALAAGSRIQTPIRWTFPDEEARLDWMPEGEEDLGQIAIQESDMSLWVLIQVLPEQWARLGPPVQRPEPEPEGPRRSLWDHLDED